MCKETVTITVNNVDVVVVREDSISYAHLCKLAHLSESDRPIVMYSAGPLRAGVIEYDETAPLRRGAAYIVQSVKTP